MRQKNAFSLIEVLLVMGIIAVVTSMGFTISQKGIEKAYNQYWYTGYSALSDATREAIMKNKLDTQNASSSLSTYSEYIAKKLMGIKSAHYKFQNSTATFTAPNGIGYEIKYNTTPARGYYTITMTVPRPKMRKQVPFKTILIYNFDTLVYNNSCLLYPSAVTLSKDYISLQNRADLLPFYVINNNQQPGQQQTINKFSSFRDAYCSIHNSYTGNNYTQIACGSGNSPSNGSLFSIDPRKAY